MINGEPSRDRIERRLHATEERFRRAQAASGIGWFEWDLTTDAFEWTPPVAAWFGFGNDAPGPRFAEWERVIFPDDTAKLRGAAAAAIESGSYYTEFRVKHPDGSLHWIAGKGEAVQDDGPAVSIAGVYYEITERKALEARLLAINETLETRVGQLAEEARIRREAEAALQHINETLEERVNEEVMRRQQAEETLHQAQKMEVIGQLTGGVAHDFNNLLMVILGNLETMQRRLPVDHQLQRMIAAAVGGASRAAQLTQRLLAFARRQPLAPEILSPNALVAGMSDLLRRALGETIRLETALAADAPNAFADANQLENALINLAVNARDAMPEGGQLTIETVNCHLDEDYCAREDGVAPGAYVGIFVKDNGSGMTPEVIEKAFEPFFTTKDLQGTGLGLSQVYGFLRQSGGHAKIDSKLGKGTVVRLYFPTHVSLVVSAKSEAGGTVSPRARQGETLLIVEDDPAVRDYTVGVTRELGYRVVSAANGPAALRVLEAHPELRLLFTDVTLPGGMNGRQLADEAVRRRPGMKVLFNTGYAPDAIGRDGRQGVDAEIVLKPFTYADLAHKIRRAFDA